MKWVESADAIGQVDDLLASVGLNHGRRETLAGTWANGQRRRRSPNAETRQEKHPPAHLPLHDAPQVLRAPAWEQYAWLRHGFSTRHGGVSNIYGAGSLNLAWTKPDDPANVLENRRRFLAAVAGGSATLVGLRQIHSSIVRAIEPGDAVPRGDAGPRGSSGLRDSIFSGALETEDARPVLRGDALMTDVPGVMLGVGVADCVPVLVADVRKRAVAAFHAGWRGTLARIVERGIGAMRLRYGSRPQDLVAVIGPSIGPCCYAVGEELRSRFESQFAYAPELFSEVYDADPVREKYPLLFLTARAPGHSNIGPQIHLDLWEANRRQLLQAGIPDKRITVLGECTACTRQGSRLKYFSHRGESGFAGRMMALIGVAK